MRIHFLFITLGLIYPHIHPVSAAETAPPRIAVTHFVQEAFDLPGGCRRWHFNNQGQLQTQLEDALSKNGLQILERKSIRRIHEDEFELPNQDPTSQPARKKFLSAQYAVTGGITELAICEQSTESGVQLGGIVGLLGGPAVDLGVSGGKAVSKVALTAKLVSTTTGEVLRAFNARSEITEKEIGVNGGVYGIGGKHRQRKEPAIEEASRKATEDLAKQISDYIRKI